MPDELSIRQRRLLGWGWQVTPLTPNEDLGVDLVLEPTADGVRLGEVEGVRNVLQDVVIALTTRLGADVFNTQFGFDGLNAISDETDPVMQRERIRLSVISVLNREPRVSRINRVDLAYGDRWTRELKIEVGFTLIDGQTATTTVSPLWGLDVDG